MTTITTWRALVPATLRNGESVMLYRGANFGSLNGPTEVLVAIDGEAVFVNIEDVLDANGLEVYGRRGDGPWTEYPSAAFAE